LGQGKTRGFTPTCVGNTASTSFAFSNAAVHPHMRGEYFYKWVVETNKAGSPPHAWGILRQRPSLSAMRRFTPTCVGNTRSHPRTLPLVAVHPHMRGEYSFAACLTL